MQHTTEGNMDHDQDLLPSSRGSKRKINDTDDSLPTEDFHDRYAKLARRVAPVHAHFPLAVSDSSSPMEHDHQPSSSVTEPVDEIQDLVDSMEGIEFNSTGKDINGASDRDSSTTLLSIATPVRGTSLGDEAGEEVESMASDSDEESWGGPGMLDTSVNKLWESSSSESVDGDRIVENRDENRRQTATDDRLAEQAKEYDITKSLRMVYNDDDLEHTQSCLLGEGGLDEVVVDAYLDLMYVQLWHHDAISKRILIKTDFWRHIEEEANDKESAWGQAKDLGPIDKDNFECIIVPHRNAAADTWALYYIFRNEGSLHIMYYSSQGLRPGEEIRSVLAWLKAAVDGKTLINEAVIRPPISSVDPDGAKSGLYVLIMTCFLAFNAGVPKQYFVEELMAEARKEISIDLNERRMSSWTGLGLSKVMLVRFETDRYPSEEEEEEVQGYPSR